MTFFNEVRGACAAMVYLIGNFLVDNDLGFFCKPLMKKWKINGVIPLTDLADGFFTFSCLKIPVNY